MRGLIAVLGSLAAIVGPVLASSYEVGAKYQGVPFEVRCPAGQYVRGLSIRQNTLLNGFSIECAASDGVGVTPVPAQHEYHGGSRGPYKQLRCKAGELATGISAIPRTEGGNAYVGDVKLYCTHLETGKTHTVVTDWRNPNESEGPYGFEDLTCPQSQLAGRNVVVGMRGGAGTSIRRIGIQCVVAERKPDVVMNPGEPVRTPPPPPPGAQDTRQRCMDYAQRAASVRATARACGLTGPRYEATVEQHYEWCVASPPEHAQSEAEARKAELAQCRRAGGGNVPRIERLPTQELDFCQLYAQEAQAQANEGQQNCGFNTPRYSVYVEDHLNWCKSAPRQTAEAEASARKRELWACQRCRGYAERTLGQFRRTNECRRPLPNTPIWQPNDYDVHFGWCLHTDRNGERSERPDAASTERLRERDLENCRFNRM